MLPRISILLFVSLLAFNTRAQQVVDVDKYEGNAMNFFKAVGGEPIGNTKFVRLVEGSPYYFDDWKKGDVEIESSKYKNISLRLNILETTLEFKDRKGDVMVCTQPVKRVVLRDSANGTSYSFVHSSFLPASPDTKNAWLMELVAGKASLYKLTKKSVNEVSPYGSATKEQHILTNYNYYLLQNNTITRVKKTSELAELLSDKRSELQEFIKTNKLSNKEGDMITLVQHYNSL